MITPNIIKHITHLEDLLIYGNTGIDYLEEMTLKLINCAEGLGNSGVKVKIDGSPAVVVATDFNGERFVALKHSWEKGKRFHNDDEIDIAYDDSRKDLKNKLKTLLHNLDFINIPKNEIWMGDILYSKEDLKVADIEDTKYLVFKPNTIVYAVPVDSDLTNILISSDLGVAWHTKYIGNDFDNLTRLDSISLLNVNSVPSVYQMSTEDIIVSNPFSNSEKIVIKRLSKELHENLLKLKSNALYKVLLSNKKIVQRLLKYRNDIIRLYACEWGNFYNADDFIRLISLENEEHINSLKTERGKLKCREEFTQYKALIESYKEVINQYFYTQGIACKLKNFCVKKLSTSLDFKTFYEESNSYTPCSGEGFVLYDTSSNICKAVDRTDFSLMNFKNNQE